MTPMRMMMTDRTPRQGWQRRFLLGLSLGLLLAMLLPRLLRAQAEGQPAHTYTYGQTARIMATFPESSAVTEARLFLRVPRPSILDTEIYVLPVNEGVALYERDLRTHPFPPFAELTYWWTYVDGMGFTQQTEPVSFLYEDNRFLWEELQDGPFTVRWVAGTPERMIAALDIARAATAEITSQLRASDPGPVLFYVYPSTTDLQVALRLTGNEWVEGMALPEVGVILLAIPPTDAAITKMRADIPHELTHQILYWHFGDAGYKALPIWLVEGLATYFEQRADAARPAILQAAKQEGQLLPLIDLCAPFYARPAEQVLLAYAQSHSAVTYLQRTYVWSGVRGLLEAYADGRDCSAGMKHALGLELYAFERLWRVWLEQDGRPAEGLQQRWAAARLVLRDLAPWLVLVLALVLPGVLAWVQRRTTRAAFSG